MIFIYNKHLCSRGVLVGVIGVERRDIWIDIDIYIFIYICIYICIYMYIYIIYIYDKHMGDTSARAASS